jgi:hypothetical protein
VDVDIEWNLLPALGDLYTPFVVELKTALHQKGKGITTALGLQDYTMLLARSHWRHMILLM